MRTPKYFRMSKKSSYFSEYGGINSILLSPFFYLALAATVVSYHYFTTPKWWDVVISVIPGLVGFSIAGVAIFISLGNDSLRAVFAGRDAGSTESSPFMKFMAMFTHFIVIQLIALLCAFTAKAMFEVEPVWSSILVNQINAGKDPFWLFGGFCFFYSIFLSMSLAIEIYRLARMIDEYQSTVNEIEPPT